jgi:glucokinase
MKNYAIGTDIGGSHITSALIDLENGAIVNGSHAEKFVNNRAPAGEIIGNWCEAITKSMSSITKDQLRGIGFAMPGPFDYEKGIALFEQVEKYYGLFNVNVAEHIREKLKLGPAVHVRFMNDATAFAVGEAWTGKAAGYYKSVSITLGTGFGSAFVECGIPILERDDVPKMGCVWHLHYQKGIADDYFSTRWFTKSYKEKTGKLLPGVKEIAHLALSGDSLALELFEVFGNNLGEFLGPWLKTFGADVLIIGGNLSLSYDLFKHPFQNALSDVNINVKIQLSELMENAAIIGSSKLLDDDFWTRIEPLLSKM